MITVKLVQKINISAKLHKTNTFYKYMNLILPPCPGMYISIASSLFCIRTVVQSSESIICYFNPVSQLTLSTKQHKKNCRKAIKSLKEAGFKKEK